MTALVLCMTPNRRSGCSHAACREELPRLRRWRRRRGSGRRRLVARAMVRIRSPMRRVGNGRWFRIHRQLLAFKGGCRTAMAAGSDGRTNLGSPCGIVERTGDETQLHAHRTLALPQGDHGLQVAENRLVSGSDAPPECTEAADRTGGTEVDTEGRSRDRNLRNWRGVSRNRGRNVGRSVGRFGFCFRGDRWLCCKRGCGCRCLGGRMQRRCFGNCRRCRIWRCGRRGFFVGRSRRRGELRLLAGDGLGSRRSRLLIRVFQVRDDQRRDRGGEGRKRNILAVDRARYRFEALFKRRRPCIEAVAIAVEGVNRRRKTPDVVSAFARNGLNLL